MPTVREVLALPVLAVGRPTVLGGAEQLDRRVRWVHSSDAADPTGLLQGGELVMTTGLGLTGGVDQIEAYLRALSELRAVGLVVELGTHVSGLPAEVGDLADVLGLPVVTLAGRIRFVDVTEQVHRLIVADQYEELQFARAVHETFTSMNLDRASQREIVLRASDLLDAPVVLEDLDRHVLALGSAGTSLTALLDGWSERSRRNAATTPDGAWLTVPVGFGPQRWGRLVQPAAATDVGRSRAVLERAAQSLLLQRMLEQDRDSLLVQALGGLLDDLLTGRVSDDAEAIARAGALGLAVSGRYVPLVISVPGAAADDALARGAVDRKVLGSARRAIDAVGLTALASIRREGTVAFLISCPDPTAVDRLVAAVCAEVDQRLSGGGDRRIWAAGTAPAAASLVAAAGRLGEAEHVAEVGAAMPGGKRLFRASDVRLRGLISLLRDDHRVEAFADTELGPLLDHDARTGDDLFTLMKTYVESGGSKSSTAAALGMSRPTLYGRLATIERILGVSLETVESRTSLHCALMIRGARERGRQVN